MVSVEAVNWHTTNRQDGLDTSGTATEVEQESDLYNIVHYVNLVVPDEIKSRLIIIP